MSAPSHIIEVLNPDGSAEWFCGWDSHGSPELSFDRDDASKYDLMFHRDECMDDYARLCEMGFDASIETVGFVRRDYSEVARLEHVFASVIVRGATLVAAE